MEPNVPSADAAHGPRPAAHAAATLRTWLTVLTLPVFAATVFAAPVFGQTPLDNRTPYMLQGSHFEVHADFDHGATLETALRIAEATRGALRRWLPEPTASGTDSSFVRRLRIHLYRTSASYQNAEAELTGGRFRQNLAFAQHGTMDAHVALQPDLPDRVLDALGPTALTLRLVAHESAHTLRYQAMPNYRDHPRWLADGLATWVEVHALNACGFGRASLEASPAGGKHIHDTQRLIDNGRMPSVEAILDGTLGNGDGALGFYEVYAVHAVFFDTLVTRHEKALTTWLRERCATIDGDAQPSNVFGNSLLDALDLSSETLEEQLRAHCAQLHPEWDERLRSLTPRDDGESFLQCAFDSNAICWKSDPIGTASWAIRGQVTIVDVTEHDQLNLLLGKCPEGFVSVSFVGGRGLSVMRYLTNAPDGQRWQQVHWAPFDLPFGEAVDFEVQASPETETRHVLSVRVAGVVIATGIDTGFRLDSAYGLGAQRRSVGMWDGVQCTKDPR